MRLSVKAPNGRVELFDDVHTMSFLDLRIAVIERFALENDFSLMCGSQELPRDAKTRVVSSEVGLVSGDRLRLVIHDKALEERERITLKSIAERSNESNEMLSSSASGRVSNSSEMRNDNENAIVSLIIDEMSKCGFYCKRLAIDGSRLLFRHAESVLSAEIDFHHYVDARSKCSHITVSVVHPAKRQFLPPVVLDEGAKNLRQFAIEHIVSPIQIALLGHENAFLRLLGNEAIAERIMKELPAKSVLRLECTCVHANKACNGSFKDRLWLFLLHRDFGDAVTPMNNESSRDAYQRLFVEREKERQRSLTRELEFHCRHPILSDPHRHPQPIPPYMPFRPDPDIPEGPFYPQPSNPFYPSENPFPGVPGFGPPRPRNPLDPFSGSELMPSRPRRPGGLPRQLPDGHSPFSGGFGGAGFI